MKSNPMIPVIVALITAAGGVIAVRAVPPSSPTAAPLPTSSIELNNGATAEGSNIINGDARIVMPPRARAKKNGTQRQVPFSTTETLPWASLDISPNRQVSALAQFRGDSQGLMEMDRELWLYVLPHGVTQAEANYVLSPVQVNENNGHWVATDVAIGEGGQALGQKFEIGLLIAPVGEVQQRMFKLSEMPGTMQTSRTFVVRQ